MSQDRTASRGWHRPPVHALERPRLKTLLDSGHALTLLIGPAGGGKSVLLMQWARDQAEAGVDVLRVTFDETVGNEYLMLREIFSQLISLDLLADPERAVATLRGFDGVRDPASTVEDALATARRPCVLLIENAQRVDELVLLERLRDLVDAAPLLRVVVATRRSLTTRALELLATTDAGVIGPRHLLFTPAEAREVIERTSGQAVPLDALGEASALPLAARLLGLAHVGPNAEHEFAKSEREQAAEALMSRLISTTDSPQFREFLLHTSVPGGVTLEIAERLGWAQTAAENLERAETYGLGMWAPSEDGPAFVYTPALREALARRLAQGPREVAARIHRLVAVWAFEHERYLEALSNALEAKDFHLASRIGRKGWFLLVRTHSQDLEQLMRRQPMSVLVRYPVLSAVMALVLSQYGHRVRAFGYFQTAALSLRGRQPDDDPIERFWGLSVKAVSERFAGHYRRAEHTADLVVETYDAMTAEQRAGCEGVIALLLSNCGLIHLRTGRTADAVNVLERGLAIRVADSVTILENGVRFRIPNDDGGWFYCASSLAGAHAVQGRLAESRRILDAIDSADPPETWRVDLFGIMEQVARSYVATAELDLDGAHDRAQSVAHHLGSSDLWPFIVCAQSQSALLSGRAADALLAVDKALEPGVNSTASDHEAALLAAARAAALLALGNRAGAGRELSALSADDPRRCALEGFIALRAGDAARALSGVAARDGGSAPDLHWRTVTLLITAVAAARLDRRERAAAAIAHACALMREERTRAPLLFFDRDEVLLMRDAADRSSAVLLDEFLEQWDGVSPFPPLPAGVTLTSRELAVMRELRRTSSTASIAEALFVSPNTVKVQRRSAYRKLGAATREQALLRAAELGIFLDDVPPVPPAVPRG